MLELKNCSVVFNEGSTLEKKAMEDLSVHIHPGEFVTILGSNGAGKSTFFNVISGKAPLKSGQVFLDGQDITKQKTHQRSKIIGQLYQNPSQGTAPHLTVEENLALANSGNRGPFSIAVRKEEREKFRSLLSELDMGLEDRMNTPIGLLSGGQRQSVALMMAVLNPPKLMLLDEHTAALDPKTAKKVLELTNKYIRSEKITALMITHNMRDALENGDRLLIFQDGKITHDFSGEEKKRLQLKDLIEYYDV